MGWQKSKYASGMLCDKRMPIGPKDKVYLMVVRPAMLYQSECWPIKKTQIQRFMVAAMRMIGWMYSHTMVDRIRNEVITDIVPMTTIKEKMREIRIKWFGHVK